MPTIWKSEELLRRGLYGSQRHQALLGKIASGISFPPFSAPNAEPSTVLDLPAAPTVKWIWCKNFLNRIHACGRQNVNGLQHLPQSNLCTGRVARLFTGGPYTNTKRALGPGLQSPSMSSRTVRSCLRAATPSTSARQS